MRCIVTSPEIHAPQYFHPQKKQGIVIFETNQQSCICLSETKGGHEINRLSTMPLKMMQEIKSIHPYEER
jgi:hypothetical protein